MSSSVSGQPDTGLNGANAEPIAPTIGPYQFFLILSLLFSLSILFAGWIQSNGTADTNNPSNDAPKTYLGMLVVYSIRGLAAIRDSLATWIQHLLDILWEWFAPTWEKIKQLWKAIIEWPKRFAEDLRLIDVVTFIKAQKLFFTVAGCVLVGWSWYASVDPKYHAAPWLWLFDKSKVMWKAVNPIQQQ